MDLTKITQISSSTTLSGINNVYLVTAGSTGFVITFPPITCDGMIYQLNREDTSSNVVTVQGTTGNPILQNLGLSGNTGSAAIYDGILIPQSVARYQSYQKNWYVGVNSSIQRTGAKSLFSTSFVANNSQIFLSIPSNSGLRQIVCLFSSPGSDIESITSAETVICYAGGNDPVSGTFDIRLDGSPINLGITGFSVGPIITQDNARVFRITSFIGLPTTTSVLQLGVTITGGGSNAKIGLFSLVIR